MNQAYKIVWNAALEVWQAVGGSAHGRAKGRSKRAVLSCLAIAASGWLATEAPAQSLPAGGQIVAGQGAVRSAGPTMTVTQSSGRMAIDWQSFSVGAQNKVQFVQPSANSVILNRVLGPDPSTVQGMIRANGQVFLVNPNGVLFTPGSQVNVGGLVASTLDLNASQFLAGQYRFSGNSAHRIVNHGVIDAPGGTVALIAAKIENQGALRADRGQVLLGAGSDITLNMGGPAKLVINKGALDAVINNGGAIQADGGAILLTAEAANELAASAINNTGFVRARTLATGEKGEIKLLGGMVSNAISVGGTLDASAPNGGDGGFIETSAAHVTTRPDLVVNAGSASGKSGLWLIDPYDYDINAVAANNITNALNIGTSVTVTTQTEVTAYGSKGTGSGDIIVSSPITMTGNASSTPTLTLKADRNIIVHQSISSASSPLNITLSAANNPKSSMGGVAITGGVALSSMGGAILIGGNGGDSASANAEANGIGFARNSSATTPAVSVGATAAIKSGGGDITINGWSTRPKDGNSQTAGVLIGAGALIDSGHYPSGAATATAGGYININGKYVGGAGNNVDKVYGVLIDHPTGNPHGQTSFSASTVSGGIRINANSSYNTTGEYALEFTNGGQAGNISFTAYSTADLVFVLNDVHNKVTFDPKSPNSGCRSGDQNCGTLTIEPRSKHSTLFATYNAINNLPPIVVYATMTGNKEYDSTNEATGLKWLGEPVIIDYNTRSGFTAATLTSKAFITSSANVGNYRTLSPKDPLARTFESSNGTTYSVSYRLTVPETDPYQITPATVYLKANREYDAGMQASASQITVAGVGGETLKLAGPGMATLSTADVTDGTNYITALNGLALVDGSGTSGTKAGLARNYQLPSLLVRSAKNTADITPTTAFLYAIKKKDGNDSFLSNQISASGINGETLSLAGEGSATAASASPEANDSNFLRSLGGLSIASKNYRLPEMKRSDFNRAEIIEKYGLKIEGTRVYNGSEIFELTDFNSGNLRLVGINQGDNVSLSAGQASLALPDVGLYRAWKANGIPWTLSGTEAADYTLTGDIKITITKAPLSITLNAPYNGTTTFTTTTPAANANQVPIITGGTVIAQGLIGSQQITGVAVANPNVGSSTKFGSISGVDVDPDKVFKPENYETTITANISAVPLTITARDISKPYGQILSSNSTGFSSAGLKGTDAIDRITLSSVGLAGSAPVLQNNYALTPSGAIGKLRGDIDPLSNYIITYVPGTLSVTPAALVITANNVTKIFGTTLPAITTDFMSKGLQNNETIGTVTRASEGLAASAIGGRSYGITLSNAAGGTFSPSNYSITYTPYVVGVSGGAVIVEELPEPQHIVTPSILIEPPAPQTLAPGGLNYIPMVGLGTGGTTPPPIGAASGTAAPAGSGPTSPTVFPGVRSPTRQFRAIGQVNDLVTPTDVFVVNGGINIFRTE